MNHYIDQNARPLLTIAIPTYNRASLLSTLLSALLPQIILEPRVELIVSDNASPDETPEIVSKFQAEKMPIRYIRNSTNLGPDRNILQCFEQATGKYVWVFGDDDVLEPTGLGRVLVHLEQKAEYDLVHVRARGFSGAYAAKTLVPHKGSTVFERAEEVARYVHVFFTFISGNIVNKDRITALPHRAFKDLAGTHLIHLGWIYTALEHHRRSLVIHDQLVATLTGNSGGYALFKVFGPNLQQITEHWLTSEAVKRAIIHGTLQTFMPPFLLSRRSKSGDFAEEDPHLVLGPVFRDNPRYWFFDFPIIRLPRAMGKLWLWMVRAVNKADKMLGSPLLRL
jgi:abequosyltransferase